MGEQVAPRQGLREPPDPVEYVLVPRSAVDEHYDGIRPERVSIYKDHTEQNNAMMRLAKQKIVYRPELATKYGVDKYNKTHKWKPENEARMKYNLIEKDGVIYTYQDTNADEVFDDKDNIVYVNGKRYAEVDPKYESTYIKVERARPKYERIPRSEFRSAYYEENPRLKKNGQPRKLREGVVSALAKIIQILSKNGRNFWEEAMNGYIEGAGPETTKKFKSIASLMKTSAYLLKQLKSDHFTTKYEANPDRLPDKKTFNKELYDKADEWVNLEKTIEAIGELTDGLQGNLGE
jgi:hypothetical protein